MMYVEFMKNFLSMIRANWWVLESIQPPEPKNVWLLLSRHDVPRVHEKFFLADWSELMGVGVISAYWAKNVWFPMMYVEFMKSFFSPIGANWWVLELIRPPDAKNVWFQLSRDDVRRVHKSFFLADSRKLIGVRVISASWAQKRLIPIF